MGILQFSKTAKGYKILILNWDNYKPTDIKNIPYKGVN